MALLISAKHSDVRASGAAMHTVTTTDDVMALFAENTTLTGGVTKNTDLRDAVAPSRDRDRATRGDPRRRNRPDHDPASGA